MSENTFRGCAVLERWQYLDRTCLLIQGPDEPPLAVFDEPDSDAVLELVPPAALLKLALTLRLCCDSAAVNVAVLEDQIVRLRLERKVTQDKLCDLVGCAYHDTPTDILADVVKIAYDQRGEYLRKLRAVPR